MMKTMAITIPVYNEESTLYDNIKTITEYIKHHITNTSTRIIIADNGSTDSTEEISKRLSVEIPNVSYQRISQKGVGLALLESWLPCNDDYVGYMDLDIATDLSHLLQVIDLLNKGMDVVYGSRLEKTSNVLGRSVVREFTSRMFNMILRLYLSVDIKDGMCGFKFLKRSVLDDIVNNGANNKGWFFSTELLVIGQWRNYKIFPLPVNWTDDPDSKVDIPVLTLKYLKGMKRLRSLKSKVI